MVKHHCCVVGCSSASEKQKNLSKYPHMKDVEFYPFPTKPTERNLWERLIRRENFEVTRHTRICSRHWISGSRCESDPHPSLFPYNTQWKECKYSLGRVSSHSNKQEDQRQCMSTTDLFEINAPSTPDARSNDASNANETVGPTDVLAWATQVDDVAYHGDATSKCCPSICDISYR